MSGVSFPVTRPIGRALIVGAPACRSQPLSILQRMGFECAEMDDPYAAMVELCRRPLVYRALILSLNSLYREELQLIQSVKRRFPHVEIWMAQAEGRLAALADAVRLGADGLLSEDGLHRMAAEPGETVPVAVQRTHALREAAPQHEPTDSQEPLDVSESLIGEPVLTAEELRALLQEQPSQE